MAHVKWLDRIEVIDRHFDGYQMERTYRYSESAQDPGEPVDRIRVRSLMVPPGIPDFLTRARLLPAGPVTIAGRAWAGGREITRVEFSDDDGRTWTGAGLGAAAGRYAWREWSCRWDARPGRYRLGVRATDSEGNAQPVEQPWNYQGMGNNMVHRVEVLVE
jgi:hypothetical protein